MIFNRLTVKNDWEPQFLSDFIKTIRPYIYPIDLLNEKKTQKTYRILSKNLIKFGNGIKEEISKNQPYFQDTLCYRLMEKFGTLCFQYKLHSGMNIHQITQTAWEVFSLLIKTLKRLI